MNMLEVAAMLPSSPSPEDWPNQLDPKLRVQNRITFNQCIPLVLRNPMRFAWQAAQGNEGDGVLVRCTSREGFSFPRLAMPRH